MISVVKNRNNLNKYKMDKTKFLMKHFGFTKTPNPTYKQYFTFGELQRLLKDYDQDINYNQCSGDLKDKEAITFDDWCDKYVSVQGENTYLYKKTAYTLFELMLIFKKIKELNQ